MSSSVELIRALGVLSEAPGPEHRSLADLLQLGGVPDPESYAATFLFQLYPYASVYVGSDGMLGGEARDRVAGAWTALGRTPPAEPDHLGALLGLYAALAEHAQAGPDPAEKALWGAAASGFLWEHLLAWVMPYLSRFEESAPPVYASWARLLAETLLDEGRRCGPPAVLPLHLRLAPELPDPRDSGSDAFLSGLLAPAVSGLVLTRADLARGAAEMNLGLRMGERRFALQTFVSQDADRSLEWLSREAAGWTRRHTAWSDDLGSIADYWSARARATRDLLESLGESDVRDLDRTDDALNTSEVATDARD